MQPDLLVLGIETSCDETAAAVVDGNGNILANRVLSQIDEHRLYGGVVPEVAARAHLDHIDHIIGDAMDESGVKFPDLTAVAATGGPGLIGGVMVGVMAAKAIALTHDIPFLAVNHLEAHALTVRLTDDVAFPYLLLLVSGGHCQLLSVEGVGQFKRLGTTVDDALGEAFDKTAKMLGLGYPGGPAVEQAAKLGVPDRFTLASPMVGRPGCDFSFSGLKTSLRQTVEKLPPGPLQDEDVNSLCTAFQRAAGKSLTDRCKRAIAMFRETHPDADTLVVAGGVAANQFLRGQLENLVEDQGMRLVAPPPDLCTDNGAMIAWAGIEHLRLGHEDPLNFAPRPRWPLDAQAALAGAKA
jgi:N6-L-threonylcarbamoyladenine synthase